MDKAKKKFANALDNLRSFTTKTDIAVDEKVQPEHCRLTKIVRHGFPDEARCLAYDPVQRLIAIGTGHGTVRMIGDVGVDYLLRHETDHSVNHVQFLINEGGLITACSNDMIHLWNFRQKQPEIVHSVQLNKESVTCIHLPMGSKWLYVGTDKGNIYFVSVQTFQLSQYVINWNKAIDLSCRVHPGPVRYLAACPTDPSKLLISYDKGVVVQWNLATKEVDRFPLDPPVKCVSWHYDGKQVMTGNVDGSVYVYNITKKGVEQAQKSLPHGPGSCRPIPLLDWKHATDGEQFILFAGGMPQTDDGPPVPSLTILRASRTAAVLEMDHPILAFHSLCQVPYSSCPQQPHSVAVLLKSDLMVLDLTTPGVKYPCIESPHAMDLHESPVTCVAYYSDCPNDVIGALTLVGCKQRKRGYSEMQWPVTGGVGRECATGHQELILTGHKDGSVRFWQASGEHLQILYRLKTGSHFERLHELEGNEKVSHAIKSIEMCLESRLLLVAGVSGQVTLFRFTKTESMNTIAVVNIPLLGSASTSTAASDEKASSSLPPKEMRRQKKESVSSSDKPEKERITWGQAIQKQVMSRDSTHSPDTSDASGDERIVPFKVRGAPVKRPAGYQPELACLIPWPSISSADSVTSTALNSAYGVIALGTTSGLALVDIAQCALIYAWTSSELYGSDPTPAIQLSSQLSDASSPVEHDDESLDGFLAVEAPLPAISGTVSLPGTIRCKSPSKARSMVNILRRNTAELADKIRDKYTHSSAVPTVDSLTDRPEVAEEAEVAMTTLKPSEEARTTSRSHSVKGNIMRKISKKTHVVARSLSFHSQQSQMPQPNIMEEGETPRDSPSLSRNTGGGASPSTSSHSLEKLGLGESVTSLQFIQSSSKRNDARTAPCLWVGTSAGATIALNLILPQDRLVSTVVVAPSVRVKAFGSAKQMGTVVKLKGQVLYQTLMDQNFCLTVAASEPYKETSKESKDSNSPDKNVNNKILTKASLSPTYSNSLDYSDEIAQILVVVAEFEVKVIALPTFSLLFSHKCEEIPLVKAQATHVRGHPVLMCLSAAGQIVVLSLPSLRLLHQSALLPHSVDIEDSICQKTAFSEHGLGVYMASPSEIEKYTICSELAGQTADSLGELFVPCELPEAPKNTSFLKGVSNIFAGTPRQDNGDLDAILSDKEKSSIGGSGAALRSVARTIPGPSNNMDRAQAGGISAGQAAQMALQNLNERGDKLNATVDASENLKNSAMNLSQRTGKLVEKYEKKKWYNF